jgi:chromosome segregation ATPase
MAEEKRRVNAAIDKTLYENVMGLGYSISEAITLGFEKLLEPPREEIESNQIGNIAPELFEAKESLIKSLEARADDLYKRIESLEEQLKVKDSQLENKDAQLEKQAVHIQSLIQENSKLNLKLLPESTEIKKKPWWQFW